MFFWGSPQEILDIWPLGISGAMISAGRTQNPNYLHFLLVISDVRE